MAITLGPSSKFVLIIGDQGAVLLRIASGRVRDHCYARSTSPADSAHMADILAQSPNAAIYPLIDILEQSFTKETIPPASMFDDARLVQRRLDTTFPNVAITASHYLGRDTSGERRDKRYLLAGLPGSLSLDDWLVWINDRHNPVKPLSLLPLEAVTLAVSLSRLFHPKSDLPQWIMLVTRHRTGGFRQVVLRHGEFVFTRLTQGPSDNADTVEVATAIKREHSLSMGYLRRMSFNDDQGMDIIVVGAPDVGPALLDLGMLENQLRVITPTDACEHLNLTGVAEPGDDYGEGLHGAAFGQKRRPIMSLLPQELHEKRAGALTTSAAYVFIALVIGYASYEMSDAYLQSQRYRTSL